MTIGRAERRRARTARVAAVFGERADVALDLLEVMDLAWHDCYREVSPPEEIVDDVLLLSDGTIEGLIAAARKALTDWRDLKVSAEAKRTKRR